MRARIDLSYLRAGHEFVFFEIIEGGLLPAFSLTVRS